MARIDIKGPVTDSTLNALNHNLIELYNMRNVLQTQINDLVLDAGKSDQEVAQARGGHKVLADRLNETEQKIEDKYIETMSQLEKTEQSLDDKKADKGALSQIAQSKRDKDVDIEMKDLSQGVKEAISGGSVAVVGEYAVGNINLKDNAVEGRNIHKYAGMQFPYYSDDSFDLDYFLEDKTVIVSGDVKNNPFGTGCQVKNIPSKTGDDNNNLWITQIAVVYGSGTEYEFGEGKYRHIRVNEDDKTIIKKGKWIPLGVDKITFNMMDKNFAVAGYLSDETYDLNELIDQGNYMINKEVKNNPYGLGVAVLVDRFKTDQNSGLVTVVQMAVCYSGDFNRKYLGRMAVRILRVREDTKEIDIVSDWSDKRVEPLKILFISNSFGLNTTNYIHEIANSADMNIVTGNLYISGGYLEEHYDNLTNNIKAYRYDIKGNVDGVKTDTQTPNVSIVDALDMEDWDYVVLNQASAQSGVYDTFQPYLKDIIDYVKDKLPNIKVALMPTWSYSNNFDDSRFDKYDNDQMAMYNAIMDAYKELLGDIDFDLIIPTGTAIQNARTDDYMLNTDDEMTEDGYHLGDTGKYTGGLTYLKSFFVDVEVDWKPSSVSKRAAYFANVAANNAILNPFKVTEI